MSSGPLSDPPDPFESFGAFKPQQPAGPDERGPFDGTSEPVDLPPDPADPWPGPEELFGHLATIDGPASVGKGDSRRWVWAAMAPTERQSRLQELREWVEWLRATFELHNDITPCWYRHGPARETLTALYAGWLRVYAGERAPGREFAEAEWISMLSSLRPHLRLPACASGHQVPPLPRPTGAAEEEAFEHHIAASADMTAPQRHPAARALGAQGGGL